jgi:N-acetylmuramoyl-L-alanine amidase
MSRVTHIERIVLVTMLAALMAGAAPAAAPESAESIYTRALARERELRVGPSGASLSQLRSLVSLYESVVRRYPRSGYCDNALWQGANVALLALERFDHAADRRTAIRLLTLLREGYPHSPLRSRAGEQLASLSSPSRPAAPTARTAAPPPAVAPAAAPAPAPSNQAIIAPPEAIVSRPVTEPAVTSVPPATPTALAAATVATIRDIRRTALPDGVRVSIEIDSEPGYRYERLENPRRLFFDIKGTRAPASLQDAVLKFGDSIVREIRLGRHPNNTTRVVMDMEQVESCSVFTLANPFRLVVDFKRDASVTRPAGPIANGLAPPAPGGVAIDSTGPAGSPDVKQAPAAREKDAVPAAKEPVPLLSRPAAAVAATVPSPVAPTTNSNGQFSLSRQLGLGISRIVLDAGHGGHDPGARANGIAEAELVLDVTLRLRELLEKQPGIEVTLTRSTDEFIPLEERTAIANRNGADLFLSIHANASRNPRARGIETYFLNFASNPEAEAVAARENSASGRTMHSLPEIVRAIALNNKIDESRDFAEMVQKSMVRRLAARNKLVRDLGVKQAPFVVLIGAGMPSVLAEISFVTNKQEGALLKTAAYRQQIAESLFDAVVRYQRSLKGVRAVASRE